MSPRVIAYRRVSTDEQGESGAGLEAQSRSIAAALEARGWRSALDACDIAVSGSVPPRSRPALADALDALKRGEADVLMVSKLDRATRSVADLCELLDLSTRQRWDFVALDLGIDTSTPMGRAMAQMAGVFSELERKLIGQRTSDALAARKADGKRLGRPVTLPEGVRQRIVAERAAERSLRAIADGLTADGVPTARGGIWRPGTVAKVIQSVGFDEEAATARIAG